MAALLLQISIDPAGADLEYLLDICRLKVQQGIAQIEQHCFYWSALNHSAVVPLVLGWHHSHGKANI